MICTVPQEYPTTAGLLQPWIDMEAKHHVPEDLLLDLLRRLPTRSLAVSRAVCKDWRAVVDDHRLLRTDHLPLSLEGVFLGWRKDRMPVLFSRRSTHCRISAGMRHPTPTVFDDGGVKDCCNGLLLLPWHVLNPATMESARLPPQLQPRPCDDAACHRCMVSLSRYLVFDPAMSPHYQVVSVPDIPRGQLPVGHVSDHVCTDGPVSAMEWPPTPYVMHVFSSETGDWKETPFAREGKPAGTVADCQSKQEYMCRYAAYCHGALYVPCEDDFVLRINLSNDKYKVLDMPQGKRLQSHAPRLCKSDKGVYCVFSYARNAFQVWFLDESHGHTEWVLRNDINFGELVHESPCTIVGGSWILPGCGSNNAELDDDTSEWDPTNENLVSVEAWVGMPGPSAAYDFLGLHPYKQIALFGAYGSMMAYHLSSSKVRDLGFIPMGRGIQVSFPYTPCWMGPLPETQFR